ncbi:glycosyltransferase family A protein [Marinobacteraceae bacterium S3BR75-40.1]
MEWPLVTVIIAAYNRNDILKEAIESIDYPNSEIIVVDDGSTPSVEDEVDLSIYKNCRLITKENGGVSSARNVATKAGHGKYFAHLDSDDEYEPGKLQKIVQLMEKYPKIGFAFHDISRFRRKDGRRERYENLHSDYFPAYNKLCSTKNCIDKNSYVIESRLAFRLLTSGNPIFPSSVVMRSDLVTQIDPWNETLKVCGDMEYFARALTHTDAIYVSTPLTKMGMGENNLSKNQFRQLKSDTNILLSLKAKITHEPHHSALNASIKSRFLDLGWNYKAQGLLEDAERAYTTSFLTKPSSKAAINILILKLRSLFKTER